MAYVISDECISCGACQAECPVEAISEGDGKYVINVLAQKFARWAPLLRLNLKFNLRRSVIGSALNFYSFFERNTSCC